MEVIGRGSGLRVFLVACLLALSGAPAVAQTTGKIEGRVLDAQTGQPLAGAQVLVLGTRLGNLTNQDGYYFIVNVPAGLHDIQAQYIGYQTATVTGQRVLAGQTMTVNFPMSSQAIALEAITIQGESNPLVPRDKTVSKAIVTGDVVDQLPVDDVRSVIALQPGVVETNDARGQVIRGGRPGEASVYVDGVLVRSFNRGAQSMLDIGTNAIEEVNVLLGGFGAEYGSAQSGVINYVTKAGGADYSGAISFGTDRVLPNDSRWGISRLEASLGGPLVSDRVSFHVALSADGMEDATPQFRDMEAPGGYAAQSLFFRPTGTAPYLDANGDTLRNAEGDAQYHTVYEEITGLGNRRPYNNEDAYTANATFRYDPTGNTKITFGAVQSRNQGLLFSNFWQARPKGIPAFVNKSTLVRAGVDQIVLQTAERQATIKVNVAYGVDRGMLGQRADTVSLEPEGPDFLGFRFKDYELFFEDKFTVDKYLARLDSIKAGQATDPLTPGLAIGLAPGDAERLFGTTFGADNPYGLLGYIGGKGLSGYRLSEEKTLAFDVDFDFQVNRVHRLGAGFELYRKTVDNISTTGFGQMNAFSNFFHNVYRVKPTVGAFYIKDRMDIGEMVIDAGLRADFFDSDALYPVVPGLVYPFEPDDANDWRCAAPPAAGATTCLPRFVEQERVMTWSPRLGVAFPISDVTNFRLSYGHFFQLPQFNQLFSGINTDISKTNTNTAYGRPVKPMKAVQFEVGLSHLFDPSTVLDVTAYNKDKLADAAYRISLVEWPDSRRGVQDGRLLTNLDFGTVRGVDLRLTRRLAGYFTTIVGYSFLNSKGTGSDPFSYINSFGRFVDANGNPLSPAQAMQYADFDQRHKLTLAATATFGEDAAVGTGWNALLRNTNIAVTSTAGSGLPWTRSSTPGASGRGADNARYIELINSSRLPWSYVTDARITRTFELGSQKLAGFVDARNLLNTRNTLDVFGFTGSPLDPGAIDSEAGGALAGDRVIADQDPRRRLEYERGQALLARYGLADDDPLVFSDQEQYNLRALGYIASLNLPARFGEPRRLRVGFEWTF